MGQLDLETILRIIGRPRLRPFDDAGGGRVMQIILDADIASFIGSDSVKVEVMEIQLLAAIEPGKAESRAHYPTTTTGTCSDAFGQSCFSAAELSTKANDIEATQKPSKLSAQGLRLLRGASRQRHATNTSRQNPIGTTPLMFCKT